VRIYANALSPEEIMKLATNQAELTDDITINITPQSDAPVLSSPTLAPLTVSENSGPVTVDSNITAGDIDNPTLVSATISVSSNYNSSEDILGFINEPDIPYTWNPTNGVLTLNGVASVADYQAILQSVTIENTSENPDISP